MKRVVVLGGLVMLAAVLANGQTLGALPAQTALVKLVMILQARARD